MSLSVPFGSLSFENSMAILVRVSVLVNEVCVRCLCLLGMETGLAGNWFEDCTLQGVLQGGFLIFES